MIQQQVVEKLVSEINKQPKSILDLGCGSGAVYKLFDWKIEKFVGVDKAPNMCILHPKEAYVTLLNEDFESLNFDTLGNFDLIISSSALQWANDIEALLQKLSAHTKEVAFAIFCDKTFKSIYEITGLPRFLPNSDILQQTLAKYFTFESEIVDYKLSFEDNLSKFRYIKKSGVSGGMKQLSYQQTKSLIANYPHDYLEFEVLFVYGKPIKA